MLQRAYSVLQVKEIDGERRELTGIATTPTPDRMGDIVEPLGIGFNNPIPLLLHHDTTRPVGMVTFDKPTKAGVTFRASIPDIAEPGTLRDRVQEAWQSIKAGLIRGVSIGFRALEDGIEFLETGGVRFTKTELLELSLVSVPANHEARISTIKSLDAQYRAATGSSHQTPSGVSDPLPVVAALKDARRMKTIQEQIAGFEATRQAKSAQMDALMAKSAETGVTLDEQQAAEYDGIEAEVKAVDAHLVRLRALEASQKRAAVPVAGSNLQEAANTRSGGNGNGTIPQVTIGHDQTPPGIGFARLLKSMMVARLDSRNLKEVVAEMYPNDDRLNAHVTKAAVPAATTTQAVWASPLVQPTNLVSEFIEYLRPQTIIGKFGTNGIPALRSVPFNIRVIGQASGGTGYWVGEGKAKPLTSFAFNATTMTPTKVAAIAVITEELARFSTPSAETLVRNALIDALVERLDIDFIDPTQAAVTGVNPASITYGLTAKTSAGVSADNARTDLSSLLSDYVEANVNPSSLVLIMPATLALALSLMRNALGQRQFEGLGMNGGNLDGIPVIVSQYAANASGSGNMVIAVNAQDIFLADDGGVTVDASREASLEMSDAPTGNSNVPVATSVVSMYQTNSIALRAERFINWAKRRSEAVVYMDDVNWGSVGSPS